MRTFVFGDIHGGYKGLVQLVEKLNLESNDKLIFLGDYVDGWSEAAQVVEYLLELEKKYECIFILGNHDLWAGRWLNFGATNPVWEEHGGRETKKSYIGTDYLLDIRHKRFFEQLHDYYIDENNNLFLHAGYTSIHGVKKEVHKSNYYFDRTLWEMAVSMNPDIKEGDKDFPKRLKHYKEIYVGHTPTTNFGFDKPMHRANIWNVDTGAGFKGPLSCIELETKEIFQSDEVWKLYPNERGRN